MRVFFRLVVLLCLQPICAFADLVVEHSTGIAKEGGEVVYTEKHTSVFDDQGRLQSLETNYFDNDKSQFGFIKTDYSKNAYLPTYQFQDQRRHRYVDVKVKDSIVLSEIRLGKDAKAESNTFELKPLLVAGQGLHNYLRAHIAEFVKDTKRVDHIQFLIPLNKESYAFRIRVKKWSPETKHITYRVEADGWLMRVVAPDIDITYDANTDRLITYDGPSNLMSAKGKKMNVIISYVYQSSENVTKR